MGEPAASQKAPYKTDSTRKSRAVPTYPLPLYGQTEGSTCTVRYVASLDCIQTRATSKPKNNIYT